MKTKAMIPMVLLAISLLGAQGIDIKGVVKDAATSRPIPGAIVNLQASGAIDTTETDGSFRLNKPVTSNAELGRPRASTPTIQPDGSFLIPMAEEGPYDLRSYSTSGRLVGSMAGRLRSGNNSLHPENTEAGVVIHRLSVPEGNFTFRVFSRGHVTGKAVAGAADDGRGLMTIAAAREMASALFSDTIHVEAPGYMNVSLPISSPDATGVAILLRANPSSDFSPCPTTGACRILPLGDSITDGYKGPAGGYRVPLFRAALKAKKNITFVGKKSNGPSSVDGVAFPTNHEGHVGYYIEKIVAEAPLPAVNSTPHIVLFMGGTNDVRNSGGLAAAPGKADKSIADLTSKYPNALIVVARIPYMSNSGWNDAAKKFNATLPATVAKYASQGKHVVLVDMHTDFPTSGLTDGVHPNATGAGFLADVWYSAIEKYLP